MGCLCMYEYVACLTCMLDNFYQCMYFCMSYIQYMLGDVGCFYQCMYSIVVGMGIKLI